jgi:aminoglycoside phosphotransferase (APT) family kinase protein
VSVGVTAAEFEMLITTLDRLQRRFPWEQPVLLHGDFTPKHLLFDDALTLTDIIDFGDFQGGSPVIDLAELLTHMEGWALDEQDVVAWLREGYGPAPIWECFVERRLMHTIGQAIGSLNYHVAINDTAAAAQ